MLHALVNKLRLRPRRLVLAPLLAATVVLGFSLPFQSAPTANAVPAGLPSHFGFGLMASPGDTWMPQSGIVWDYRYQYLAGGVNTGSGWEMWNANGTFALNYANESAQHGYIPMFSYYELVQSSGSCGNCNENQKDITNLNTPSLMQAYYSNFALLMQRLGPGTYSGVTGFGKTALVNVEPDFSGGYAVQAVNLGTCFGFCTGQSNDPSLLKASVADSGYADVAAYPNTYAGFTQALTRLRDLYAPNVLLGYDVSPWATGDDIGMDTSTSTNGTALGQEVGAFLSKVGPHELLFNDPLDRDAGQYLAIYGQHRWWDRLNVTYPNFARWEQYLHGAIAADGGKPMLLWQVPLGNQYFDTENNTNDHYQDNRAEYIFGHVSELIQTGIVGAMFGSGNSGNTTYNDQDNDGVSNPPSICTTNGISSGQICNTAVSTTSDDDGGYVRMQSEAYYQNPVALTPGPGSTNTPTPIPTGTPVTQVPTGFSTSTVASPYSVPPGGSVSITSSVSSSHTSVVLVDLELYDGAGARVFQQFWDNQTFAAAQTRTYSTIWSVPANAASGTYTFKMGIFSPGWGTLYSWNNTAASLSVVNAVPTATPVPVACVPRPVTSVSAVAATPGTLRVTIGTTAPGDSLMSIQLGNPDVNPSVPTNALVDINGQVGVTGPTTQVLPTGTSQLSFAIRRANPGLSTTVPIVVTDACGPWPTVVGGGPTAF